MVGVTHAISIGVFDIITPEKDNPTFREVCDMLFSNPIAAAGTLDFHLLNQIAQSGVKKVEIQLPDERYTAEEVKEIIRLAGVEPVAFRMPNRLGLGTASFDLSEWTYWLETVAASFPGSGLSIICHGAPVPLGVIFEYLDARPTDFNALQDFKEAYVGTIIQQLKEIKVVADKLKLRLLIENAPMGSDRYFEPGQSMLYPALRTPRHLLQIVEEAEVGLLLDTAHARISSNVLTYMHRSRSLFAGATEKEIMSAPADWVEFCKQVKGKTGLIRLSYAVSWGDTPETKHIPFPSAAYSELIRFAEQLEDGNTPVILVAGNSEGLKHMLRSLHDLKKS
jgi:sugar phosphate isomerase/epimerase